MQSLLDDTKFRQHLKDLAEGAKAKAFGPNGQIKADEVQLYIVVPQNKLTMFENIESTIHGLNIDNIKKLKVFVTTIENGVGI